MYTNPGRGQTAGLLDNPGCRNILFRSTRVTCNAKHILSSGLAEKLTQVSLCFYSVLRLYTLHVLYTCPGQANPRLRVKR